MLHLHVCNCIYAHASSTTMQCAAMIFCDGTKIAIGTHDCNDCARCTSFNVQLNMQSGNLRKACLALDILFSKFDQHSHDHFESDHIPALRQDQL